VVEPVPIPAQATTRVITAAVAAAAATAPAPIAAPAAVAKAPPERNKAPGTGAKAAPKVSRASTQPDVASVDSRSVLRNPDGLFAADRASSGDSSRIAVDGQQVGSARVRAAPGAGTKATAPASRNTATGVASVDGHSSTGSLAKGVASGGASGACSVNSAHTSCTTRGDATAANSGHGAEARERRAKRKAAEATAAASKGETPEQRAKRKAAEAAAVAARAAETPEQRAKRKEAEAAAAAAASAARKAKREAKQRDQDALGNGTPKVSFNLYEGLPEADPEKDAIAAKKAEAASKAAERPKLNYTEDRTRIIFLDIDGVLRPLYGCQFQMSSITMDGESVPIVDGESTEFSPTAISSLRDLLEESGAAMVLSSEWRRLPSLRDSVNASLHLNGLPKVIDDTPQHGRELTGNPLRSFAIRRAREIGDWLRSHPEVRQWVALDDIDLGVADEDRQPGQPLMNTRLVLTDKTACLTSENVRHALAILNGKLNKPRVIEEIG